MQNVPADWLESLSADVAECMAPAGPPTPIGAHVQTTADELGQEVFEVSLFYGATEVVGGPRDGSRTEVAFWLDLSRLSVIFERIDEFAWQASPLGADDDLGPHVALEGERAGRRVRLRILAAAPALFPVARTADARRGVLVEHW